MTLTLEDLLSFMKQEKVERKKDREDDMKTMKELIMKGVEERVETAVNPMKERRFQLEQEQVKIKNQFSNILQEIKELQKQQETSINLQLTAEPDSLVHSTKLVPSGTSKFSSLENILKEKLDNSVNEETKEIRGIASEARKIIGLSPISKEDVERVCRISDKDSAYLEAVNEYFKLELRMSQEEIDNMGMKQVFPPAKEHWDTLYVGFESERAVNTIYRYARNLRKGLVRYIPKQFYDRYRAMEAEAYLLRHTEEKYKTKVQMGINDLVLYKKNQGGSWSLVACSEEWPTVNLTTEKKNDLSVAIGAQ